MNKILAIAIVFAILAWVISMNCAYAYNCPTNGCYGYTPNEAQNAYDQQQYQHRLYEQNEQILQNQQNIQNELDRIQREEEGY